MGCLVVILGVFWAIFFAYITRQQEMSMNRQLVSQARGIYHYIISTRRWISGVDGLYVKEGDTTLKLSPGDFIARLGEFMEKTLPYTMKMAVPNARDPSHAPDPFEKRAIDALRQGTARELWRMDDVKGEKVFRYAAPLTFEHECTSCHPSGQTRPTIAGCIAISFPAKVAYQSFSSSRTNHLILILATLAIALVLILGMLRSYVLMPLKNMMEATRKIEEGALGTRLHLDQSSEWKRVAESFNAMAGQLEQQHSRLERAVEQAVSDLKKTQSYKAEFFSNITHDLKTPITAIKGAVELLKKKLPEGSTVDTYLDILERNTGKLSDMVRDMLDCARLESGVLEMKPAPTDFAEMAEDAIMMVIPLAWEKGLSVNYQVPTKRIPCLLDKDMMERALFNLLENAIKYSPKGGTIEVLTKVAADEIIFSIRDQGPGLSPEEASKAFEKFFHRGNPDADDGVGLGLAIARGIVKAHGGRIWVESSPGEGATFFIRLSLYGGEG